MRVQYLGLRPRPTYRLGLPGGNRTPDLQLRRLLLYPVELQSDLVGRLGVEPSTNGL